MSAFAEGAFVEHERHLWGLLYRMTGSTADADDLVQETFVRAMERPPRDREAPLRPWLVRVAVNLGRDHLRRRRRERYVGPWLPTPLATRDGEPPAHEPRSPSAEARYDLVESVSTAFLLALEALTPLQRAVLLLRDVFDYTTEETSEAMSISIASAKTTLHRARKGMARYDAVRARSRAELSDRTRAALDGFLSALGRRDLSSLEALLAEDARLLSDGGGEFVAARNPIFGANNVARFLLGIAPEDPRAYEVNVREINGLPGVVVRFRKPPPRVAPRAVVTFQVGPDGRVTEVQIVLATKKIGDASDFRN